MKKIIYRFIIGCSFLLLFTEDTYTQHNRDLLIDASLHFVLSAEITFASGMFFTLKNPEMSLTSKYVLSGSIGIMAGFVKELADDIKIDGTFDWLDMGVDVIGVGTGLLLHYCIFDKKRVKSNISLNISESDYLATVKIYF